MNRLTSAVAAGAAGALATNALHEIVRRIVPNAPRIDLLGMQAMAKMYRGVGSESPTGDTLYVRTLIGDLLSNGVYYSFVGLGSKNAVVVGAGLGIAAGLGAVVIPGRVGLSDRTVAKTALTAALTVGLYTAGGVVAGLVRRSAASSET